MNQTQIRTDSIRTDVNRLRTGKRFGFLLATVFLGTAVSVSAQAGGELQQKLAAIKQSAAENQQKLHQYQWIETTQLTLKGDEKPGTQSMVTLAVTFASLPDGTNYVQQSVLGATAKQLVVTTVNGNYTPVAGQ